MTLKLCGVRKSPQNMGPGTFVEPNIEWVLNRLECSI